MKPDQGSDTAGSNVPLSRSLPISQLILYNSVKVINFHGVCGSAETLMQM